MNHHYTAKDIVESLISVGLSRGDSVFTHSNIGFFGVLKGAANEKEYYRIYKKSIFEVIGKEGTLIVPTFSYSFCKGQVFDSEYTPGCGGLLSECLRKDPEAKRSEDANFSVAALGRLAEFYTRHPPEHSFAENSFWHRFLENRGKICNFNFDSGSTFFHYVEKCLKVPYRFDKAFTGAIIRGEKKIKKTFYHFVYDKNRPEYAPVFSKFDKIARSKQICHVRSLGRGQIVFISAKDTYDLIEKELKKNPELLIVGEKREKK